MGNLSSNISQNIQEFANNLIEEERSKSNSLNQSIVGDFEEDKFDGSGGGSGQTYINGKIMSSNAFYPNFTQKTIRVLVDSGIQLDVDIMSDNLNCGWLISEVTRMYTELLLENNRLAQKYAQQEKDFHHLVQQSRRQQLNFNQNKASNNPFANNGLKKEKKKLIVALKTYEENENLDHWLTMYDKPLNPIQDGEVLVAYFAKICPQKKKQISVGDFELIKVIGRGGFSRVILCRKKDTGRLYAMKILKKSKIIREKKIKPILSERSILEKLDHPFIVKLHWAFQSKEELFFVMDICTGGEIFFHLNNFKRFPEQLAKFYFIEILLGLEYLHNQEFVYRDIKPENILIDIEGHVKIADFGLAKYIPNRTKSYSFCGSPEYMSPEMLKGRGHDKQLDYYCVGALLFEMLTGLPPYYSKDTNEMYHRILNDDLTIPDYLQSNPIIVDLLQKLLAKDPKLRVRSVQEIKNHAWLKDTQWKKYLNKEISPPFIPSMRSSNFDPEFNDLPIDFDELQMKLRLSTERRQSYYYESTLQSKTCTENSVYFQNHPLSNLQDAIDNHQLMQNQQQQIQSNTNASEALLNNFFANPGDDIKDIYNDSSGTNNTNSNANNSIQNIKQKSSQIQLNNNNNNNNSSTTSNNNNLQINNSNQLQNNNNNNSLNNQSSTSKNEDNSDVFKNFSFYDSPLEENEILSQIRKCCIKIGQLPQHLYSTNPTTSASQQQQNNGNTNNNTQTSSQQQQLQVKQQQLNSNLEKIQSHMSQWMSSSKRLICEELEEEDESSNQKTSQDQEGDDGQLHALPSELSGSNSIIIEQSDIALDKILKNGNTIQLSGNNINNKKTTSTYDYTDSTSTMKNKETNDETSKRYNELQYNQQQFIVQTSSLNLLNDNLINGIIDIGGVDFTNVVGSFSSKSINTYDESNQSVAQELRTNESIAVNNYAIANMKYNGSTVNNTLGGNQKLMNSDECQANEINNMVPVIKNHQYKKSMINPTQFRPPLEIQLPEQNIDEILQKTKQLKQDSSTNKTTQFLPTKVTPSKKEDKNNMKNTNSGKDLLALSHQKQSPKNFEKPKKKGEGIVQSLNNNENQLEKVCVYMAQNGNQDQLKKTNNQQQQLQFQYQQQQLQIQQNEQLKLKFNQSSQIQQKLQETYQNNNSIPVYGSPTQQQQQYQQQQQDLQQQQQNDFKMYSRIQEQFIVKKSFLNEIPTQQQQQQQQQQVKMSSQLIMQQQQQQQKKVAGIQEERSPENLTKQQILQKRQAAKFRSMDFSAQYLNRATSQKAEDRLIVETTTIDQIRKHEMLSDLKEASKEGNSISLSPLRSGILPDMRPNPGGKIQTLKGNMKSQNAQQINQKVVSKPQPKGKLEQDNTLGTSQASKINQSSKIVINDPKKKTKPNTIKIDQQIIQPQNIGQKKSPTQQQHNQQQQQQQIQIQQKQKQQQQEQLQQQQLQQQQQQQLQQQQQELAQKNQDQSQQSQSKQEGKAPHSSKNSNQRPNLFSEKSQSNLQTGSTSNTPTQGQVSVPTTMKQKIDFFSNGTQKEKDHVSGGTSYSSMVNQLQISQQTSSNVQTTKTTISTTKVQSSIKKKLQQQMESGVSRNDNNPKITSSSGAIATGTGGSLGSKKTTQPSSATLKKKI